MKTWIVVWLLPWAWTWDEARADEPHAPLEIDYGAPAECLSESAFREHVVALVHTDMVRWQTSVQLRVRVTREGGRYAATLVVAQGEPAGRTASHARALGGSSCSAVLEALAVSAALAIDEGIEAPRGAVPSGPAPAPDGDRISRPPAGTPPARLRRAGAAPRRTRRGFDDVRVGDEFGLRGEISPRPLLVQTAWVSVGSSVQPWPVLRADIAFGYTPIEQTPFGSYRLRALDGGFAVCTPRHLQLLDLVGVCSGVLGGVLVSDSFDVGLGEPAVHRRPWFAAHFTPRVTVPLLSIARKVMARLVAEGGLVIPFVRDHYTFYPNQEVYEARALAWRFGLGLEISLTPGARAERGAGSSLIDFARPF